MSVPCGSTGPFFILDRHLGNEITAHRDKVFAALSQHSDPALREIGRLLASGTVTPQQLLDNPLRAGRKPVEAVRQEIATSGAGSEAGPASRPGNADPDNGAGGVPAIRR